MERVTVLLATRNGLRWLPEQVASILDQQDVEVRIIASDDASTDGTAEWLVNLASRESRVTVLPSEGPSGSAAANFYRLMRNWKDDDSLIAFSDQDDLWAPNKLSRHASILRSGGFDGVSSDVVSFNADGRRTLIRKSYPQRKFDYLLESPGPGSTFLMTPRLVETTAQLLSTHPAAPLVDHHDWLVYAIARARGWRWHIDAEPSVEYRQHESNAMGSNQGIRSGVNRLQLIGTKWHRSQAVLLSSIAESIAPPALAVEVSVIRTLLESGSISARFTLSKQANELRRRPRDQRIVAGLIAAGVW